MTDLSRINSEVGRLLVDEFILEVQYTFGRYEAVISTIMGDRPGMLQLTGYGTSITDALLALADELRGVTL